MEIFPSTNRYYPNDDSHTYGYSFGTPHNMPFISSSGAYMYKYIYITHLQKVPVMYVLESPSPNLILNARYVGLKIKQIQN